jgi:hypothetical protein
VREHLPSNYKALNSNPSTTTKEKCIIYIYENHNETIILYNQYMLIKIKMIANSRYCSEMNAVYLAVFSILPLFVFIFGKIF